MLKKLFSLFIASLMTSMLTGCFDLVDKVAPTNPALPQPPTNTNNPPQISGSPSRNATVGRLWSFTPSASDPDGDRVAFLIENQPAWASFNGATGTLSGAPQLGNVGEYPGIRISASDGTMSSSLPEFTVSVQNISSNNGPTISGTPPSIVTAGQEYVFAPSASDTDGDTLSFDIANRPAWASFNSATGELRGTPAVTDTGLYQNIVISVRDGTQSASLPAFIISVENPAPANNAPQISGSAPTTATVGQVYAFQPSASDPDGDNLVFAIANPPSWASFDPASGMLGGTPAVGDEGLYQNIVVSVSDGQLSTSLPGFSISVDNPDANDTPLISGNPPSTATVGQSYLFQPNASDPDGDTLMFEITNLPVWASFDSRTGMLGGTPADGNEDVYQNIVISVNDGVLSAALPGFDITVEAADINEAPSISGAPPTSATVDQLYSFLPSATDPDGDDLTFLIDNQPSWASFNPATGQLSGTPVQGEEAIYNNIVISVSDGELTAALSPFSITVSQAAMGSVTLTWTAPTRNTDGSTLTDLIAYKIYYGTSPGNYPNEVRIDNPGVTMHMIENLSANTYYFVSTSINSREIESDFSNMASKTIN